MKNYRPLEQGLYSPQYEHDACGVGFICNINGKKSHTLVEQGIEILNRLSHRGATGADPDTGDGAGILLQTPHTFFESVCSAESFILPAYGKYGTGLIFLPQDDDERAFCKNVFEKIIRIENQKVLGWRKVPVNSSCIGKTARHTEPVIEQIFIEKSESIIHQIDFERRLYIIRKQVETSIRDSSLKQKSFFYITNLSSRTVIYKGLLMPSQLNNFFLDLQDPLMESAICMVHSRYSTNTFPTWDLAQPFRFLAHNGEINTLRGNINWMSARERLLKSDFFVKEIEKIKPVIVPGGSDSASIDNEFELLMLNDRSLPHSMMMLIPEAWEHNTLMEENLRNFYKFHATFMEPWDGPAAIAFTDGTCIGAILDRNGLRPARYIITKSGVVMMASEVGVLDVKSEDIKKSGRLEPGKIFFIDTENRRIIDDTEIKETMATRRPYGDWVRETLVSINDIPKSTSQLEKSENIHQMLLASGYSREDLKVIIKPMAEKGEEPIGSMGNDTPHAVLSQQPQLLFDYFKQLFAQVTNPPIDPIREKLVMSLDTYLGSQQNILDETARHCEKIHITEPVLSGSEFNTLKNIRFRSFKTTVISILFPVDEADGFKKALDRICREAVKTIQAGNSLIVLSDRGINEKYAALPSLLAMGAVHEHLVKNAYRTQTGIIVESAEPREVHHFALLFGYGADCIYPYLADETIDHLIQEKELDLDSKKAKENYRKAINKGLLKILSKMGISTLNSYRGSQIFEALGLHSDVVDRFFTGTPTRIGGADLKVLATETELRHKKAFPVQDGSPLLLLSGGKYQWKRDGEFHLWNPETIAAIQDATRRNDYDKFKEFSALINNQEAHPTTLRSLLTFKQHNSISIDEVEPAKEIMKRFATGAMSFGSISKGAHESLALAMNMLGGKSNTGEGGEDPSRFIPLPNGTSRRSAIKQIASGRFGVSTNYLVNADELQIKIAQGAKPGEGGQLPGHKVSAIIAKTRYTTPGVTLISPPPHHDIYSIEDLAQLIFDLKNVNPLARISVKLVSEIGVGTVAAGVAKGHADMILISGADGGTGASPLTSIKHAGLPWELGLSETHQTLVLNDLRSRVRLQTDGQLRTGRDVAIAALLGAEEFGFCTGTLIVLGCIMLRHCHLNNCSVGVATQDALLEKRFMGRPEHVVNFIQFVVQELREIMASLGIRKVDDMIGKTEFLELNKSVVPWKAQNIDFSKILYTPAISEDVGRYCKQQQKHEINDLLDHELIKRSQKALEKSEGVHMAFEIKNTNRTTGAMLSGEVCKRFGEQGLGEDTIECNFFGVAGQSFGAFLAKGITFTLEGMANDYVGKGISGGKIIIYPNRNTDYKPDKNTIIGNTSFYGAIAGEAYINGVAGERFCIRNSGLYAVVEGVGDHGCEYMTGGRVLILGETGKNFAAGMSGGIAYIYDVDNNFKEKCNMDMIEFSSITSEDQETIYRLIKNHLDYTHSQRAKKILEDITENLKQFVKVIPIEYKRILDAKKVEEKLGLAEVSDG